MARSLRFGFTLGIFLALLARCGGDTNSAVPADAASCFPAETRQCVGPGACQGGQICNADGTAFGFCDCGADASVDGSGGAGAAGGAASGGASSGGVGGGPTDGGADVDASAQDAEADTVSPLAPELLLNIENPHYVALDDTHVFITTKKGAIVRIEKDGKTPTPLAGSEVGASLLALDDTHGY